MRILHIRIENFGTVSDFDLDCSEGLNVVMQRNGWGKTTLAAFIRTMFYGLEGGRKRDYSVNDRARYQPWNKGYFGGEITFEANGKTYVLGRDFGTKDSDVTFSLFDKVTGLPSKDYTENIGVELFGIDSESYKRTGFIDHDMIKYDGINSTISSKVSTLSQTNDLNNFDKVDGQFKDYLNTRSPKKKTGSLYQLNEEIQALDVECKKEGPLKAQLEDQLERKRLEKEQEAKLKIQREEIQAAQRKLGEKKGKITALQTLLTLHTETEERLAAKDEALKALGGKMPSKEVPERLTKLATDAMNQKSALEKLEKSVDNSRYERLNKYFKNEPPTEEEVKKALDESARVGELLKKNDNRSLDIETKQKTIENLRQAALNLGKEKEEKTLERNRILEQVNSRKAQMEEAKNRYDAERREYEKEAEEYRRRQKEYDDECKRIDALRKEMSAKKTVSPGALIPGILATVVGIVVLVVSLILHTVPLLYAIAGVLIVLGIVLMILGFAGKKSSAADHLEYPKAPEGFTLSSPVYPEILQSAPVLEVPEDPAHFDEQIAKTKEAEAKCQEEITAVRNEIEADGNEIASLENSVKAFLDRFAISYSRTDAQNVLYEMKSRVGEYKEVSAAKETREHEIAGCKEEAAKADEALKEALGELDQPFEGYDSAQKFASDLSLRMAAFEATLSEYNQAKLKEDTYRGENAEIAADFDAKGADALAEEENEEEKLTALSDSLSEINGQLDEKAANISSYDRIIESLYQQMEGIEEKKETKEAKKELYDEGLKRYEQISKTKEYLQKSKESFIARFMSPIKGTFERYYAIMASADGVPADFRVDAQMNFTKKEEGTYREIHTQSEGYSDMIGTCIRFALLDVMYQSERPVVIMDDPFVNLDEEHLKSAKEFLQKVSEEYQIIYCTCHKDRA